MMELVQPLVTKAKELQSFIDKHGDKRGNTKVCSSEQLDLMDAILRSYTSFLPEMMLNNSGFYRPEDWVADAWKVQQAMSCWQKKALTFCLNIDNELPHHCDVICVM